LNLRPSDPQSEGEATETLDLPSETQNNATVSPSVSLPGLGIDKIVAAWPALPEPIREAIFGLVQGINRRKPSFYEMLGESQTLSSLGFVT
jgi:hypothetical protein